MGNRFPLLRSIANNGVFCVELATSRVARRKTHAKRTFNIGNSSDVKAACQVKSARHLIVTRARNLHTNKQTGSRCCEGLFALRIDNNAFGDGENEFG